MPLANWTWRGVQQFIRDHFGLEMSRSSCLRYLHRLGFVWKRPKKRLVKADPVKRADFVKDYAALQEQPESKRFFVDEAHFRADGDLHGKWTQRGQPALVDSTSPRLGEKVTYYSAVCVETGEVESLALEGYSSPEASVLFLRQLRRSQAAPLLIIWDNGPAHSGEAVRAYLTEPEVRMRLLRLPPYSPDYNADEAIWKWVRAEATTNTCLGTAAKVRERVDAFFATLPQRTEEVKRRCRTLLHAEVAALTSVQVSLGH